LVSAACKVAVNKTPQSHLPLRASICFSGALCLVLFSGCLERMTPTNSSTPRRDINAVLADHDDRLLAIPGVVGVCVSLLDDQKTPCLKVMLARKDRRLEASIPRTLDGYPVITKVTGEIRPMNP
jgi:hypothetical protein